jgi:hypothetical protein
MVYQGLAEFLIERLMLDEQMSSGNIMVTQVK